MEKQILIVHSSLLAGGTEKSVSILANSMSLRGYSVSILLLNSKKEETFFKIDNKVNLFFLDHVLTKNKLIHKLYQILKIRLFIKKIDPEIIISFLTENNVLTVLSSFRLNKYLIISDRNNPKIFPTSKIWKILRFIFYRFSNKLVLQTNGYLNFYKFISKSKIRVIPNGINLDGGYKSNYDLVDVNYKFNIIAAGRLSYEKNFILLIRLSKILKNKNIEFNIRIFGEGELENSLKSNIILNNLSQNIKLMGISNDIEKELKKSDVFVLPSLTEGFPNILVEAMSYGLPVIATNCSPSISEIIENNENGIIIKNDNHNELATQIIKLRDNKDLRKKLGTSARETTKKYNQQLIVNLWEDLFSLN